MTKKDYVLIANVFARLRPTGTGDVNKGALLMWVELRDDMAHALAQDNAAFDMTRFIVACDG